MRKKMSNKRGYRNPPTFTNEFIKSVCFEVHKLAVDRGIDEMPHGRSMRSLGEMHNGDFTKTISEKTGMGKQMVNWVFGPQSDKYSAATGRESLVKLRGRFSMCFSLLFDYTECNGPKKASPLFTFTNK